MSEQFKGTEFVPPKPGMTGITLEQVHQIYQLLDKNWRDLSDEELLLFTEAKPDRLCKPTEQAVVCCATHRTGKLHVSPFASRVDGREARTMGKRRHLEQEKQS